MDDNYEPDVPRVAPEELKKAIDTGETCIILDVRTSGEHARGKIAGSMNIPVDSVSCDVEKVVPDKQIKVYVYCLSGSRSAHAVDVMIQLGYTNVFDVQYGLLGWRAKYYPVE